MGAQCNAAGRGIWLLYGTVHGVYSAWFEFVGPGSCISSDTALEHLATKNKKDDDVTVDAS